MQKPITKARIINTRPRYNNRLNSALLNAVASGDHNLVDDLLDAKANPNAKNRYNETALQIAAKLGHHRVARYICREDRTTLNKRNK